jgi:phosphoglycerol transferase MdoB-like AlkP superfamily enzyme
MFKEKLKNGFKAIGKFIKKAHAFLEKHSWLQCILIGVALNYIIESLHRHSPIEGFIHMFTDPLVFIFNALIISTLLSVAAISRFRYQIMMLICALFLALGITNCVILAMRVTPFEWVDMQIANMHLILQYLHPVVFVLIIVAIVAVLIGIVFLFIKGPRTSVKYLKNSITALIFIAVLGLSTVTFRAGGILLSEHVKNIANAYMDYGFNYCFVCSIFDVGIEKPSQYGEEDIKEIVEFINGAAEDKKENGDTSADGKKPNIIFLQLESFFDVNHLSNMTFSEDPIPNFSKLQKEYSSGYLTVPSIGAGTANTEFEVISGMSLEYFGIGEYPYKTILQKNTSESMCYNLDELGYKSHALHNNVAVFYDRNIVFQNLGFDTFTSLEYMDVTGFTPNNWAKDDTLIPAITDALDSSEGSDLVYTITVQSHGKYPTDYVEDAKIRIDGISDQGLKNKLEYYVNQLNEVDAFLGDLLQTLEQRGEDTVVVMFGDHLPSFEIKETDLKNGDIYQTEFVIWDNFGLKKQDANCYAYQLASNVFERLGFDSGLVNKLHQNYSEDEFYQSWLEILEYDMLYGGKFAWGGAENYPYTPKVTKLGVKDLIISEVVPDQNGNLTINGQNFTNYSKVYINDRKQETVKINKETLLVNDVELAPGDRIVVSQVDVEGTRLSHSKVYLIGGTSDSITVSLDENQIIYKNVGLKLSTAIAIIASSLAVIALAVLGIIITKKRHAVQKTQE